MVYTWKVAHRDGRARAREREFIDNQPVSSGQHVQHPLLKAELKTLKEKQMDADKRFEQVKKRPKKWQGGMENLKKAKGGSSQLQRERKDAIGKMQSPG